jgi:hypothetical protein
MRRNKKKTYQSKNNMETREVVTNRFVGIMSFFLRFFIDFFVFICWACILIATLCLGLGWWYFAIRCPAEKSVAVATEGVG